MKVILTTDVPKVGNKYALNASCSFITCSIAVIRLSSPNIVQNELYIF